ncbi:MAG: ABC transporter ATP-binding protein [Patulibacter sp.]|nr:ABC transporter ATP-binding protein [Patulibacter sp.]
MLCSYYGHNVNRSSSPPERRDPPRATLSRIGRVLHAEGLVRRYGDRTVLHGVDVHAAAGEVVAILGPNGAGKTTLLSLLAGLQDADAGTVGRPAREVGWIPQQPAVYRRLTVRENLELFARLDGGAPGGAARADAPSTGTPDSPEASPPGGPPTSARRRSKPTRVERRERVDRMLDEAGLRDRADDLVGTLSGGGQQRVNIAVGLLADPPVVLLDEPSSSLDPRQRERMWRFLTGLATAGRAVVFSTHDVAEAERYADTILVLVEGRIAYAGAPTAFAATADGDLLRAFVDLVEGTSDAGEDGPAVRRPSSAHTGRDMGPPGSSPTGDGR